MFDYRGAMKHKALADYFNKEFDVTGVLIFE